MRYFTITLLFSICLLVTNCSTSEPLVSTLHNPKYAKSFKTQRMLANFKLNPSGYGNSANIQYQVKAFCGNSNCNSAKAILSFYVQTSVNQVYLSNHNLSISAGKKSYQWDQDLSHYIRNSSPANGRIISVVLKESELKQIADSKDVSGTLAGYPFSWSYNNRTPLRLIAKKLN